MKNPKKFILNLYEILEDPNLQCLVYWVDNGQAFSFQRNSEFETRILQKYFRTTNVHSFLRQLSLYGFKMRKNDRNTKEKGDCMRLLTFSKDLLKIRRGTQTNQNSDQQFNAAGFAEQNFLLKEKLKYLQEQQQIIQQQLRIQCQIQLLIAQKIGKMVDLFVVLKEFHENETQQRFKSTFISVLFGYKPSMEYLQETFIDMNSPMSEFLFSPNVFPFIQ
ncbi:unnamed protein product (macronuclear) [Paramecium tetraurelia]|uniref:HSF-type DNA-binding domain-containing protein n=1 Tax=Paramecium tetraurelia TaxID=5888 RepID=A0BTM7_PARTE|nr:uncharacterized protein GSPATT00032126001 [Paramecium tetraurelia]CAK61894.1 unnamed protein product [Paramecium tetraurelia]|eukprot:XP_001429292.1 hypothetical protein (macronuclear) [Paramecium tetraurelia strain d4-2]